MCTFPEVLVGEYSSSSCYVQEVWRPLERDFGLFSYAEYFKLLNIHKFVHVNALFKSDNSIPVHTLRCSLPNIFFCIQQPNQFFCVDSEVAHYFCCKLNLWQSLNLLAEATRFWARIS